MTLTSRDSTAELRAADCRALMNMGPGGEGWGPAFPFGGTTKVAWSTVCEPLNAGLPPKKHLHDLTTPSAALMP